MTPLGTKRKDHLGSVATSVGERLMVHLYKLGVDRVILTTREHQHREYRNQEDGRTSRRQSMRVLDRTCDSMRGGGFLPIERDDPEVRYRVVECVP